MDQARLGCRWECQIAWKNAGEMPVTLKSEVLYGTVLTVLYPTMWSRDVGS